MYQEAYITEGVRGQVENRNLGLSNTKSIIARPRITHQICNSPWLVCWHVIDRIDPSVCCKCHDDVSENGSVFSLHGDSELHVNPWSYNSRWLVTEFLLGFAWLISGLRHGWSPRLCYHEKHIGSYNKHSPVTIAWHVSLLWHWFFSDALSSLSESL